MLSEMASQCLIYRKWGSDNILAAFPLSVAPTAHQVRLADGRRAYAMCAVDAFRVSFLFRQDIAISSLCHHCQIGVEVKVVGERISFASPASTVVRYIQEVACCIAAEGQCPSIDFSAVESIWRPGDVSSRYTRVRSFRSGKRLTGQVVSSIRS